MDHPIRPLSRAINDLWAINQEATRRWFSVAGDGFSRWLRLNQELVGKLAARPDPIRALEAQGEYVGSLLSGAWRDTEQRVEIVATASRQLTEVLSRSWVGGAVDVGEDVRAGTSTAGRALADAASVSQASAPRMADAVAEAADDDLEQIDGIGSVTAQMLRDAGISTVGELALLDVAELESNDHPLHSIAGRIVADQLVEQARRLASSAGASQR